jgi:hypothetical protein
MRRAVRAKAAYTAAKQNVAVKRAKLEFIDSRIRYQAPVERAKTRAPYLKIVQSAVNALNNSRDAWHEQLELQTKTFHEWQRAELKAHENTRRVVHSFRLLFPSGGLQNSTELAAKRGEVAEAVQNASMALRPWKRLIPKIKGNADLLMHKLHELQHTEKQTAAKIASLKEEIAAPAGTRVASFSPKKLKLDLANAEAYRSDVVQRQQKVWTRLRDAEDQYTAARELFKELTKNENAVKDVGKQAKSVEAAHASKTFHQARLTQKMHDLNTALRRKKKLAKLAQRFLDTAILRLQVLSSQATKSGKGEEPVKEEEREALSVQIQEAEDRRKRASEMSDAARLEVKKLEGKVAATKKLVSTWAQAEKDTLNSVPPSTMAKIYASSSMSSLGSKKNESTRPVPVQQAEVDRSKKKTVQYDE